MSATLFRRRLAKEKRCEGHRDPQKPILSSNPKTGFSLNLPVLNCQPTQACAQNCYACQGPSTFCCAIEKAVAVDRWIRTNPRWAAQKTACEAGQTLLRLNGSGDITPAHLPYVRALLRNGVRLFGFTKRRDTWTAFSALGIQLMFSIDVTMDRRRLTWALRTVPRVRLAYCRRPGDPDWSDRVGVTFPEHGPYTNSTDKIPGSETDCPAVRLHTLCKDCLRCT